MKILKYPKRYGILQFELEPSDIFSLIFTLLNEDPLLNKLFEELPCENGPENLHIDFEKFRELKIVVTVTGTEKQK